MPLLMVTSQIRGKRQQITASSKNCLEVWEIHPRSKVCREHAMFLAMQLQTTESLLSIFLNAQFGWPVAAVQPETKFFWFPFFDDLRPLQNFCQLWNAVANDIFWIRRHVWIIVQKCQDVGNVWLSFNFSAVNDVGNFWTWDGKILGEHLYLEVFFNC